MNHPDFEAVIGLEVHAQLQTQTKAFAPVASEYGEAPNTQLTPLCLGHPGTLPQVNEELIHYTVKMGLATGCEIARRSIFARKNYFYPDLPKGYQISQYETPICFGGELEITLPTYKKRIGLTRIHMEEDSGKSLHDQDPYHSLIDLNRAGSSLIEIVSEPDIRTPQEAYAYLTRIRQIVQYLDICDGNMEEGSLRCDANVSVRPRGREAFGTRTELKNMNSFRNVEKAIQYEIDRQIALIQQGGEVVQETLLWDPNTLTTRSMRSKEEAHDYRYFPEPDLPPVVLDEAWLESVKIALPELPDVRRARFIEQYSLGLDDAVTLTDQRALADFFEALVEASGDAKASSAMILSNVLRVLNERGWSIGQFQVGVEPLAQLIGLKQDAKVNSSAQTTLFMELVDRHVNHEGGKADGAAGTAAQTDVEAIAKELDLIQVSDDSAIETFVDQVLAQHSDEVERYKEGKTALMGFFVGQVMKVSRGQANPELAKTYLLKKLDQ
ncbi:MAG TPA: Asp-tRNA(Asn)/Glu-tRNA(Gln) amidotransferase GatCAB subunit B [Bacteroidetes bacterium]|nr:Asp-tRNA(Asn)/Glu-tRNA(Gln) amidotransferase GatCAB subunit B [Bacteroidota bacterium]